MSELKIFKDIEANCANCPFNLTEGDINKCYNDCGDKPNECYECDYLEYYLKSEADKVIAEKDKEIQRLENLCESYRIDCDNIAIREANAYKEIERENKRIRYQKYKRCLAMAKWCMDVECKTEKDADFLVRWEYRWLALAVEPTWAKFLQLIHKEAQ